MAKFCGKCGTKLDEITGLCPNCDSQTAGQSLTQDKPIEKKEQKQLVQKSEETLSKQKSKKQNKSEKSVTKKTNEQQNQVNQKNKHNIWKFLMKFFLWLCLIIVISVVIIGVLIYTDVIDIPFSSDFNKNNVLKVLNDRAIVVDQKEIVMESETEGTVKIIVKIPDYELLFKSAYESKNPDEYLVKALALRKYELREYEKVAKVTVEDGVTTVHSAEVIHQALEEALVNAINALSEVKE